MSYKEDRRGEKYEKNFDEQIKLWKWGINFKNKKKTKVSEQTVDLKNKITCFLPVNLKQYLPFPLLANWQQQLKYKSIMINKFNKKDT